LIIGSVLMLMLILWFFFAKVSVHETSQEVSLSEEGTFLAAFTEDAINRIQPGMEALIRIFTITDQPPLTLEGVVFDIDSKDGLVEIVTLSEELFELQFMDNLTAQVDIEIERITPFHLVQRYSGQYVENGNPQELSQQGNPAQSP
jgi:hypothetical protein